MPGQTVTTTAATLTVIPIPTIGTWNSAVDAPWNSVGNWINAQGTGVPGFSGVVGDQASFNGASGLNVDIGNSNPSIAGLNFGPHALDYNIQSSGSGVLHAALWYWPARRRSRRFIQLADDALDRSGTSSDVEYCGFGHWDGQRVAHDRRHTRTYIGAWWKPRRNCLTYRRHGCRCRYPSSGRRMDDLSPEHLGNFRVAAEVPPNCPGACPITLTSGGGLLLQQHGRQHVASNLAVLRPGNAPLEVVGGRPDLDRFQSLHGHSAISAGAGFVTNFIRDQHRPSLTVGAGGDPHLRSVRYRSSFSRRTVAGPAAPTVSGSEASAANLQRFEALTVTNTVKLAATCRGLPTIGRFHFGAAFRGPGSSEP